MATFYNQATLSYSNGVTSSNIVSGELIEVLAVNKNADSENYTVGEDITYLVHLINAGTSARTGLTVTDDLGAYTSPTGTVTPLSYVTDSAQYYVNGILQAAPTVTATAPLTVTGLSVPAGGVALLVYRAVPNEFAPLGTDASVTNTASVTGPGIVTPLSDSATVTALDEVRLSITKAISPSVVAENDRLTYTFIIQNTGSTPAVATDDLVITDTFDPILTDIVVTLNGATWEETGNYTYDESTGVFTTVAGSVTVPAATYTQDPNTGEWSVIPGTTTIRITGTV